MRITVSFTISDRLFSVCARIFNKRVFLIGTIFFFAGYTVFSRAQVAQLITFYTGDIIYADDLNSNFSFLNDKVNNVSMVEIENQKKRLLSVDKDGTGQYIGIEKRYIAQNESIRNQINMLARGTIPVGIIAMWAGSNASIPNGWALCDGAPDKGRPDLSDKFIVGAAKDDTPVPEEGTGTHKVNDKKSGTEAGHEHDITHEHTNTNLITDSEPPHNHKWASITSNTLTFYNGSSGVIDYSVDTSSDYFEEMNPGTGYLPYAYYSTTLPQHLYTDEGGLHTHRVTLTNGTGQLKITSIRSTSVPPYLRLYYIIRCDNDTAIKCD